ncbi:unnamed protein product [Aphanomyces euteiches]|uniref:SCP domain-containing protein n=1 Tax=Aphanomyces euteiches TaxID=100861 RepID=A0A6G0WP41_9STRA|nr:hypothetical protein Ae201684_013107 [Aphanomyces euteiches]KAH9076417.1 hypothetical protein Ae201684P_010363 [Aphanomyces euteiches]
MNVIAFFSTLALFALSASPVNGLTAVQTQMKLWVNCAAGRAAKQLHLIPVNAVEDSRLLARFLAASKATESAKVADELSVASWTTLPTNERAGWLQHAAQQNRLRAVESDPTDTSKIYLSVASTTSSFSILCANPPLCMHRINVSEATATALDSPFALLSPSETTTYLNNSLLNGAVRSALLSVEESPVLLLEFQTS